MPVEHDPPGAPDGLLETGGDHACSDAPDRIEGTVALVAEGWPCFESLDTAGVLPALSSADRVASELDSPMQWIAHNTHFVKMAFAELQELLREYANAAGPEARAELARLAQEKDLPYLTEHVPAALIRTLEGLQRIAAVVMALRELARHAGSRP
jgi:hypothetical protein